MIQISRASHYSPGEAIMLGVCVCPNQQGSVSRKFLRLPAWFFFGVNPSKHFAIDRDMTRQGIFFYSDVRPSSGPAAQPLAKAKSCG